MMPHWSAVIGDPIEHSLSPRIFRFFRDRMSRNLNYVALRLPPSKLIPAVASARNRRWVGWNVTLPHKIAIMPLLDDLDDSAREVGAVNVVRFLAGRAIGYNTDSEGFLAPLRAMSFPLEGRRAVVIGSGGAAKAVIAGLKRSKIGSVRILSRSNGTLEPKIVRETIAMADLVVQATSLGMDGESSPLGGKEQWKRDALAYDLVYRPVETPFLCQAREGGAKTLGGLSMLVSQAAATWRIWFDETIPNQLLLEVQERLKKVLQ